MNNSFRGAVQIESNANHSEDVAFDDDDGIRDEV